MTITKPRVFVVTNNADVNNLIAGILWLKGTDPYKFSNAQDCIQKFKEMNGKVDVVLAGAEIASDRQSMLIVNVKKINPNTKILAIGDTNTHKTRILDYGADEFSLVPLSPENVADKVFMLISREAVEDNR